MFYGYNLDTVSLKVPITQRQSLQEQPHQISVSDNTHVVWLYIKPMAPAYATEL